MESKPARNAFSFHSKEITAIVAGFVVVSMLMFSMGILVGSVLTRPEAETSHANAASPLPQPVAQTLQPLQGSEESGKPQVIESPFQEPPKELATAKSRTDTEPAETIKEFGEELKGAIAGSFSVQVGSYPTQQEATDRVNALKKRGYLYAYTSAAQLKEIDTKHATWYRVWLGYFKDADTAQRAGKALKDKGEVKNYLVRKTDGHNQKN